MLPIIYTIALALVISVFVEIGVTTFYRKPESDWEYADPESKSSLRNQQEKSNAFAKEMETYYGTVSIVSLIAATILLAVGLSFGSRLSVISDGILLGGVFTLLYGCGVGITRGGRIAKFIVATVSLIVVLALGYLRFLPHS